MRGNTSRRLAGMYCHFDVCGNGYSMSENSIFHDDVFHAHLHTSGSIPFKCGNDAVEVFAIILTREFFLLWLPRPISRELAEEECPLISRVIAKKTRASSQHLQLGVTAMNTRLGRSLWVTPKSPRIYAWGVVTSGGLSSALRRDKGCIPATTLFHNAAL